MSRFLVTGGAGFIGSHLVAALIADGHAVRVLDDLSTGRRENVPAAAELMVGSVTDTATIVQAMVECDGCFHLAAIASVERCRTDWVASHEINLTGTIHVFDAARNRPIPVIYASSAAVYGSNQDVPLDETSATKPISAYGADKLGCELHAAVAHRVYGVPSIGFRPFNVYGTGQDASSPYSGVISIFAERIRAGQQIDIFGDGGQTRDFVAVDDVVECLKRGMYLKPGGAEILLICSGRETSLLDLATTMAKAAGREPAIRFAPERAGDIRRSLGNPARLEARLGFRPSIELQQGLRNLL